MRRQFRYAFAAQPGPPLAIHMDLNGCWRR